MYTDRALDGSSVIILVVGQGIPSELIEAQCPEVDLNDMFIHFSGT